MVSGIVYFDEIVENIKDVTGIENMRPLYSRIRRFCYNCELDIGAGGVLVLKKKEFNIGDGFYDGVTLRLPEDFAHEWTYGSMLNGIVQGNVFRLFNKGPDQIDFKYLGFLLDEEGNPFTTRNRLPAVVAYSVYRLYSSRYFMGTGNNNQYQIYKMEYEDAVMAARGNDAFPSEEEWNAIGAIRLGGTFEGMTDCGMKTFCLGSEDPSTLDTTSAPPDAICIGVLEGIINGVAYVVGSLIKYSKLLMEGEANGASTAYATLIPGTLLDFAIEGVSNGVATVTGQLFSYQPTVLCNESFSYTGNQGTFSFILEIGSGIGISGIKMQPYSVPDRFRIHYNGVEVANSKFIGAEAYEQQLLNLGYDASELALTPTAPGQVQLTFYKATATPSFAVVYVDAPLQGTAWNIQGVCPTNSAVGSATVTGTLTPQSGGVATVIGVLTDAPDFYGIATLNGTLIGKASLSGTSFGGSTL